MKAYPMKKLIEMHDLSFDASTVFKALGRVGVITEKSYFSTTGSGEEKKYKSLEGVNIRFGENTPTNHPFKTEPRFYQNSFPELLAIAVTQLTKEVEETRTVSNTLEKRSL